MKCNPQIRANKSLRWMFCLSLCICLLLFTLLPGLEARAENGTDNAGTGNTAVGPDAASGEILTARPSVNGRLHVEGAQLVDENGTAVQLRGISTHGLTWYPDYLNESLSRQLSEDWNCSLLRLPMYSEIYCKNKKDKAESLALVRKGINLAVARDMYVLVDWHILEDADPNQHIDEAIDFFGLISAEYADVPNLIYEICNEPNGTTGWTDVSQYSNQVIPVIRKNSPDSVILVGTPEYDRNLGQGADPGEGSVLQTA